MPMITVKNLFEAAEHMPTVSEWIYSEFWTDKPDYNPGVFEDKLRNAQTIDAIPISLIAFVDSELAGTINLVENDDETRSHLTPWLAALIVKQSFRNLGVGTKLVLSLLERAKLLGIKKLYLGTDNPEYYAKLGAKMHEQARQDFFVMRFDLNT
jgi:predicted N-acetyltransferase YhbS